MAQLEISNIDGDPRVGSLVVLSLKGEVDPRTINPLKDQLERLLADEVRAVIIDMSQTTNLTSSALAVFVKFSKNLRDRGGVIGLTGLSERLRLPFEMLGLLVFFRFFDSVDEARAAFHSED